MKKLDVLEVVDQTVQLLQLGKIDKCFLVTLRMKETKSLVAEEWLGFMLRRMWRKMPMERKEKIQDHRKTKNDENEFLVLLVDHFYYVLVLRQEEKQKTNVYNYLHSHYLWKQIKCGIRWLYYKIIITNQQQIDKIIL